MSLGLKIQRLRKSKNLSQEAFADIMKVSRQSVSKWELDQTYPEISKLIEIADFFQITLDELLRDNQSDTSNDISLKEENYIRINEAPKDEEKTLLQRIRSLPKRMKIMMLFVVGLLIFYLCYLAGDYSAIIAYMSSALTVSIIRRLKGEYVER